MNTKVKNWFGRYSVILIWIVIISIIAYKIVQKHMMIDGTDYLFHAVNAIDILQNGFVGIFRNTSYPIWGLGVKFFERIMHFRLFDAAAWTTVIFYVLNYFFVVYVLQKKMMTEYSCGFCASVAGVLMLVQPISWSAMKFEIISGRALINTWHNPTNIVARGMGIVSIYLLFMIVDYWENKKQYPVGL